MFKTLIKALLSLSVMLGSASVLAQADFNIIGQMDRQAFNTVKALLNVPEDEINFTDTKLSIDKIIDPNTNIFKEKNRLAVMVGHVKKLGNPQTSTEKKDALS